MALRFLKDRPVLWGIVALFAAFAVFSAVRAFSSDLLEMVFGPPAPNRAHQERLRNSVELARSWTGDCPDWDALARRPNPNEFLDAHETVLAAASFGSMDAMLCDFSLEPSYGAGTDESRLQHDYMSIEFARLIGADAEMFADRRRALEELLSDDERALQTAFAEDMKRDLDWVLAQGWLGEQPYRP